MQLQPILRPLRVLHYEFKEEAQAMGRYLTALGFTVRYLANTSIEVLA